MKVLVLGHKGMLGHMAHNYLISKGVEVVTTSCRWPTSCFKETNQNFDGDYIINCIGSIHQRTDQFNINWELPQWLDKNANCKIIYPGTDCEMDDDDYGNSRKRRAQPSRSSSRKKPPPPKKSARSSRSTGTKPKSSSSSRPQRGGAARKMYNESDSDDDGDEASDEFAAASHHECLPAALV